MLLHTPITAGPPNPRLPSSLLLLLLHALVVALFFNPQPMHSPTAAQAVSTSESVQWVPPVPEASESDVLEPFVPPELPWSAAHRGIDIGAPQTEIVAPAAGEITFEGVVVDRPVLTIRHPNGLLSSLEPVETDLEVGDTVSQGDVVANLSAEIAHCDNQCVHWGVRKPDAWQIGSTARDLYIDPAFLLGWTEPSVLWPLESDPGT